MLLRQSFSESFFLYLDSLGDKSSVQAQLQVYMEVCHLLPTEMLKYQQNNHGIKSTIF